MTQRRGFTLIELLVVIAIIAILAAILFPVFARARAKAQQNNCLSNVKELALATIMYTTDYDDMYPISWETGGTGYNWGGAVYPYVKNIQIFGCPAGNTLPSWAATSGYAAAATPYPWVTGDYAENGCLGASGAGNGCSTGWFMPALKQVMVQHPAQMYMIFATLTPGNYALANPDGGGGTWVANIETRHNTGGNISYCDGHASWLSQQVLYNTTVQLGWDNL